ncbi:hypothetical protein C8F01DRAFT_1377264 [Mycena amicta]|nr:hypothetical protein C8F01DRAFT_1377264 [Mycena amicta]
MTPITAPTTKQPAMQAPQYIHDEKAVLPAYHDLDATHNQWSQRQQAPHEHKHCHNGRLRRLLVPALILLVSLSGLIALLCFVGDAMGVSSDPTAILDGLFAVKRAVVDGDNGSTDSGSTFTKHKLYLIVIFVGLLVVLVLGVMLAAWCCKGSFENPLCCPCYLCACCGGLACLECIGCGLCAEGVDQM